MFRANDLYRWRQLFLSPILWTSLQAATIAFAGDLLFKRHVISENTDYSAAALIDVNHDGRIDIVCGGDWYEGPTWKKHFVADIPRIGGRPDGFSHLEFDVNRDGWMDVITVNYRSRSIKWMEHPGASLGPWTVHTAVEPGAMETGRLVDIDGDGQLDLLPNGANFAAWWEFRWPSQEGPTEPAWIRHDLPMEAGGHGLGFGDIDGDGRGDIAGQNGWLSAPADARNGQWQWHPEYRIERGSIPMLVVDADEDGDNDIVWSSAHGFGVYWLEQLKHTDGSRFWERHAIDTSWSQGHSPLWVDLDGDGRKELVTGKRYMAHGGADPGEYDPIAAYRYQFDPVTRTWNRWTVSPMGDRVGMGLDPKVADIDGDGDLDLMASGRSGLYWLENLGPGDSSTLEPVLPVYDNHQELLVVKRANGESLVVDEPEGWGLRRAHIVSAITHDHGALPGAKMRVPLKITVESEHPGERFKTELVRYKIDAEREVKATILTPNNAVAFGNTGIVCMFEADELELANQVGTELAERGFVCVIPELITSSRLSLLSDSVWQAMRAADVLQASEMVNGEKIGFVGNAANGQLGMYVAAYDQRFIATVTDVSRARSLEAFDPSRNYSLSELMAAAAPRALFVATEADAPLASMVHRQLENAAAVFALRRVPDNLTIGEQSLKTNRDNTYAWLESKFRRPARGPGGGRGIGNAERAATATAPQGQ